MIYNLNRTRSQSRITPEVQVSSSAKGLEWRKMRHKNTLGRVGEFYQHLVAQLLSCVTADIGREEYGDIFSNDLGIRVEVKARDNKHLFGLGISQKRGYEDEPPFPLSYTLYALVTYRNNKRFGKNDKRPRGLRAINHSPLARLAHKHEQHQFLAGKIDEIYLLDIEVINALENLHGLKVGHFAGRAEEQSIVLSRTDLRRYFRNGSFGDVTRELGLKSKRGWARSENNVAMSLVVDERSFEPRFTLVTVLRKSLHAQILEVVRPKILTPP